MHSDNARYTCNNCKEKKILLMLTHLLLDYVHEAPELTRMVGAEQHK
jgi:hypothetical protein